MTLVQPRWKKIKIVHGLKLTYRIPNLQFDDVVIDSETIWAEFNTNSNLMFLLKLIIHNSFHEATLANTSVANDDQLKQVILGSESLVSDNFEGHLFNKVYLFLIHHCCSYVYLIDIFRTVLLFV